MQKSPTVGGNQGQVKREKLKRKKGCAESGTRTHKAACS